MPTKKPTRYFEIFDGGDLLRVEIYGTTDSPSIDHRNKQWLDSIITAKGSSFQGRYSAELMVADLQNFRQQLVSVIYGLDNVVVFKDTQGYLRIDLQMEPDEYTEVKVTACDVPDIGGLLTFKMAMNKADIEPLAGQLEAILERYAK